MPGLRERASESQRDFIRILLEERAGQPQAEAIRTRLNAIRASNRTLNRVGALAIIEALKALPKNETTPQVEVAPGYYAIPSPTDPEHPLRFYRVKAGKGRWAGWTFVDVQASDEFHPLSKDSKRKVLAAIAADPEAGPRYGQEIGRCYECNRTLTDPESIRLGIGPDCRAKRGP